MKWTDYCASHAQHIIQQVAKMLKQLFPYSGTLRLFTTTPHKLTMAIAASLKTEGRY
jgi:hypothetical protein